MDEVDFNSDINKYVKCFIKDIVINNIDIGLDLREYNDKMIIEMLTQWQTCLAMLGKGDLFKSKEVLKIVYCLLTDCCTIDTINGNKMDLDIYDPVLERFLRIDVVDDKNRFVKLRIFTVCKNLIVIDCKDTKRYKIYELYNVDTIKEYYGDTKVNFDDIIKNIKLEPKFTGSFRDLNNDFKRLSVNNFVLDKDQLIETLENFMITYNNIEKKIQQEYNKLYKVIKFSNNKSNNIVLT